MADPKDEKRSRHRDSERRDRDKDRESRHRDSKHRDKERRHRRSDDHRRKHSDEEKSRRHLSSKSERSRSRDKPPKDTTGTFTVGEAKMRDDPGIELQAAPSMTDGFGDGEDGSSKHGGRGAGAFGIDDSGDNDMFAAMGIERKRREVKEKPDPTDTMGQSSRELNKAYWQGSGDTPIQTPKPTSIIPGSTGSSWRLTKLRRTYETAAEEKRDVLEVALERYGSIEAFREAEQEKRILDERGSSTPSGRHKHNIEGRRFMFTENEPGSRPGSRSSFRRPGETPRSKPVSAQASKVSTPVPSAFTPPIVHTPRPSALAQSSLPVNVSDKPVLTQSELNKLQAKILKVKLMGNGNADELEKEYEFERERASNAPATVEVKALPTLDGMGRLYDIGTGKNPDNEDTRGKKRKKEPNFETHDPKTGELLRHNADDDSTSLAELVRQERFGGGAQDQKNMDFEMASRIATDGRFQNDLDYFDENAEKLARKKLKTDTMKKAFAVQDYAKTQKALANCTLCFGDNDEAPRSALVALGTRAYLGLLDTEGITPGHCRIVPIQHHFSLLEADDDTWDEIRNFMKTLMQMYAEEDQGVIFYEMVLNLKHQRHSYIEAVPVPFELFDLLPGYFREAIDTSEQEWSQHKKRIVFSSTRPFRRSMVPNLPYFMVQWDYKGEKGYGHVIEGVDDGPEHDAEGYELRGELGEKGAGEFPRWFATEIIGNMLELEPLAWRKPKRLSFASNAERVKNFRYKYDKYDWTKMLKA